MLRKISNWIDKKFASPVPQYLSGKGRKNMGPSQEIKHPTI